MTTVPEKIHAELGASVAARWMACPGSVRLSREQPNYETEHSRAGTAAHALAETCLRKGLSPENFIGTEVEGVPVDEEMAEAVKVFVDYCRVIEYSASAGRVWVEHRFSLASLSPPQPMFGTADFVAYHPVERRLSVVDYKNGSGVVVEAKQNKQLRYYALGALLEVEKEIGGGRIDEIVMTIVQPRAAHPEGVVRSDHISYFDLLAFAGELMDAARATLDPNAPLHAGPHCRFCPAAAICPEQREQVQALAQVAFDAMPLDVPPAPDVLPPEEFWRMMRQMPILTEWSRAMYAHAQRELEAGRGEGAGYKLVEKRQTRRWKDEAQVERWLWEDQGYRPEEIYEPQKLKSPAQIEKLVGKKNLPQEFVEKHSSGVTMVPESDKRPAVSLSPGDVFEALPTGG